MRPIVTTTSEEPNTRRLNVNSQSIAVPLDLKGPVIASGWFSFEESQTRFNPIGHGVKCKFFG